MTDSTEASKKAYLIIFLTFALFLIAFSGHSISMTFEFYDGKAYLAYMLAVSMMFLVGYGLAQMKLAVSEENFEQNRTWAMVRGVVCFMLGIVTSTGGSIHGLHYQMTHADMQKRDIEDVHRYLDSAVNANSINIESAVSSYSLKVEAALKNVVDECQNPENRGCGKNYQERKNELDKILGRRVEFISARNSGINPSPYAIEKFRADVRDELNKNKVNLRNLNSEMGKISENKKFINVIEQLEKLRDDYRSDDPLEVDGVLNVSWSFAKRIEAAVIRVNDLLRMPGAESAKHDLLAKRPPSIELKKAYFFWDQAIFPEKNPPIVGGAILIWCILFGILFEVAFAASFYQFISQRSRH